MNKMYCDQPMIHCHLVDIKSISECVVMYVVVVNILVECSPFSLDNAPCYDTEMGITWSYTAQNMIRVTIYPVCHLYTDRF